MPRYEAQIITRLRSGGMYRADPEPTGAAMHTLIAIK